MKKEIDRVKIGSNIIIICVYSDTNTSFPSKKCNITFFY